MAKARKPRRMRPRARTLPECLREFLTPAVWKQARQAGKKRKLPRWDMHRLILVLLLMTWCCGDSLPEKFEAARGFYVVCCPKRRRPGKTLRASHFLQVAVFHEGGGVYSGLGRRIHERDWCEMRWGRKPLASGGKMDPRQQFGLPPDHAAVAV